MKNVIMRDLDLIRTMAYCCDLILRYTEGVTEDVFLGEERIRDACAFRLLVIGDRAGKVSDGMRAEHGDIPWDALIALGNDLEKTYGTPLFDNIRIWDVVSKDIADLRDHCRNICDAMGTT